MRYILLIVSIMLVFEHSNFIQLFISTDTGIVLLCHDCEEEKKTEKEPRKFDKLHYYFVYTSPFIFLSHQKRSQHKAGLCMKGHCALIDQPPEA
jgi:hypothetical protein